MLNVCLDMSDVDYNTQDEITTEIESRCTSIALQPKTILKNPKPSLNLRITSHYMPTPYTVSQDEGVAVSLWQSEGICQYAGIHESSYAALCSLLGIAQWRALKANPLLEPHDLRHPPASRCLFAMPDDFQDFALTLETPHVCSGCMDFYHCLGADLELIAILDTLAAIRSDSVAAS